MTSCASAAPEPSAPAPATDPVAASATIAPPPADPGELALVPVDETKIEALAFSPDHARVAIARASWHLELWSIGERRREVVLALPGDASALVWSKDGGRVGAITSNGVAIFDARTGALEARVFGNELSASGGERATRIAPDLATIARVAGDGRKVELVDVARGEVRATIDTSPERAELEGFVDAGRSLVVHAGRDRILVVDAAHGDVRSRIAVARYAAYDVEVDVFPSPNGKFLAVSHPRKARLDLVDARSGRVLWSTLHATYRPVWSPDGESLAYGRESIAPNDQYLRVDRADPHVVVRDAIDRDGSFVVGLTRDPARVVALASRTSGDRRFAVTTSDAKTGAIEGVATGIPASSSWLEIVASDDGALFAQLQQNAFAIRATKDGRALLRVEARRDERYLDLAFRPTRPGSPRSSTVRSARACGSSATTRRRACARSKRRAITSTGRRTARRSSRPAPISSAFASAPPCGWASRPGPPSDVGRARTVSSSRAPSTNRGLRASVLCARRTICSTCPCATPAARCVRSFTP